jgi:hypothetical protein
MKMAVFWDVAPHSLVEIDRGAYYLSFYQTTRRNIPEDSHLYTSNSFWYFLNKRRGL